MSIKTRLAKLERVSGGPIRIFIYHPDRKVYTEGEREYTEAQMLEACGGAPDYVIRLTYGDDHGDG